MGSFTHCWKNKVRSLQLTTALLVCAMLAYSTNTIAQTIDGSGFIRIDSATFDDKSDAWILNVDAEVQLSPTMRQGLNNGVPLQFIVEVKIKEPRRYWLDKTLQTFQYRYSLIYYELTRHYRLQSMDGNQSHNYRSLIEALDELGRVRNLTVMKPDHYHSAESPIAALRFQLDSKALPLPLQPLISSDWRLASEEYAWSLN
jgi:hypothetical protein